MALVDSRGSVLSGIYYSVLVRNTPSKHDVDPMLVQCWPTIRNAGSTSNQHWFNASCLLGCVQPSKHKTLLFCVLCGVFWNVWRSKKLQVRDYLFKWTELFRIKYVRSCIVGLPNHPQLRNYMTLSIRILFTLLWFLKSDFWTNVVTSGPAWSIKHVATSPFITRRWNNIGLILRQRSWQWTNVSQY